MSLNKAKEPHTPWHWSEWHVPNFSDWMPGDVVLVETPSANSVVRLAQATSPNPLMQQGSSWTHAGVYVGEGFMVDAMYPQGVVRQSVWNYCQARALRLRRIANPGIPARNIQKIATVADSYVGQPYARWQAVFARLGLPGAQLPLAGAIYCSTLVALAVIQATGMSIALPPFCQPVFPAVLAMHPWLSDVMLEWREAV